MGKISPNNKINIVIIAVAHQIANHSSIDETLERSIAIFVAKAAINVLTRLLITNIVIKNLSVLSLSHKSVFADLFHFLVSNSIVCLGIDITAISLPAEKAEKHNKIRKIITIHNDMKIIK